MKKNKEKEIRLRTELLDITRDINAALMLNDIISYQNVEREGFHWLARSSSQWFGRLRLSRKKLDRATQVLMDLGLVSVTIYKFDWVPTRHYRLIEEKLLELLQQVNAKDFDLFAHWHGGFGQGGATRFS
jgi:hypothetical protein